jgi:protein O-mannosyl-transferase
MRNRRALVPMLLLLLLMLLGWAAYAPGLRGSFLFDDFGNLPVLGATGPVDNWPTFWRYITSGTADPTGRPLTLLSFLLDARDWPADPFPFKRTSLILHLLNGMLLYALLARLGSLLNLDRRRSQLAAAFGMGLWLLHPLLVSTTLYIVQREAMLPGTCVLIGLLMWLHGRERLSAGRTASGLILSILGLGGFTALGVLAKANGALLPVYALLIEIVLVAPRQPFATSAARRLHRGIMLVLGALPTAAILFYLSRIAISGILSGGPANRPWTYAQRLLTEPRVLMDYLSLLWLPRPFSTGLFNDQYPASTSLLHPGTTLPALIGLLALGISAWWIRRRYPAMALAVLFYLGGQLLESSSIALELYFEHRNYIPAMLMFWPLGLWLSDTGTLPALKRALMVILPLGLALMTHARAEVWGDERTQALIWARINPASARAQANAAQIEMNAAHPAAAIRQLEATIAKQPDEVQLVFNLVGARCMAGGVRPGDLAAARTAMQHTANPGSLFAHWFDRMLPTVQTGGCPGLTLADLDGLIEAGLHNPRLGGAGAQQDLIFLRGRIALARHDPQAAQSDFQRALDQVVQPGMALQAAATLGGAGYPSQGLRLLDYYESIQSRAIAPNPGMPTVHAWVLTRQGYWPHELTHLRHQLRLDAGHPNANTGTLAPAQSTAR